MDVERAVTGNPWQRSSAADSRAVPRCTMPVIRASGCRSIEAFRYPFCCFSRCSPLLSASILWSKEMLFCTANPFTLLSPNVRAFVSATCAAVSPFTRCSVIQQQQQQLRSIYASDSFQVRITFTLFFMEMRTLVVALLLSSCCVPASRAIFFGRRV